VLVSNRVVAGSHLWKKDEKYMLNFL